MLASLTRRKEGCARAQIALPGVSPRLARARQWEPHVATEHKRDKMLSRPLLGALQGLGGGSGGVLAQLAQAHGCVFGDALACASRNRACECARRPS